MDLIGTLSLVFDIPWMADTFIEESDSNSAVARASKTTRLGARAGRMTKLLRLMRLVRIVRVFKLYKYFFKISKEENREEMFQSADKIATELGEMTSKQIACVVMIMVIIQPILVADEPFLLYNSFQAYMTQFEQK